MFIYANPRRRCSILGPEPLLPLFETLKDRLRPPWFPWPPTEPPRPLHSREELCRLLKLEFLSSSLSLLRLPLFLSDFCSIWLMRLRSTCSRKGLRAGIWRKL
uniref:Uncharacterized protein n=1 Tax=Rhizophora mucronata TaxID=61149 RepID=A0A2P2L1Q3_RHIMU